MASQEELSAPSIFLSKEDMVVLTGYRNKTKQIAVLKRQGVLFRVNGCGDPVVAIAEIEGRKEQKHGPTWEPKWAK